MFPGYESTFFDLRYHKLVRGIVECSWVIFLQIGHGQILSNNDHSPCFLFQVVELLEKGKNPNNIGRGYCMAALHLATGGVKIQYLGWNCRPDITEILLTKVSIMGVLVDNVI